MTIVYALLLMYQGQWVVQSLHKDVQHCRAAAKAYKRKTMCEQTWGVPLNE